MKTLRFLSISVFVIIFFGFLTILPGSAAVTVINSYVANTPYIPDNIDNAGDYGDTVAVIGGGVTSGDTINIYWDIVSASGLLNSTTGEADGTYEIWFDVPSDVIGNHYIWVKDVETGQTAMLGTAYVVVPRIKLSISEGLPDDEISISGYGYQDEVAITITFDGVVMTTSPSTVETDENGAWSATIDVPTSADTVYVIEAYETNTPANTDTKNFEIGAAISLDVTEGPSGTVIEIVGRGFTPSVTGLTEASITMDTDPVPTGAVPIAIEDDDTFDTSASGTFTQKVILPSLAVGDYGITVNDGVKTATVGFEVRGITEVEVDPEYAVPGSSVTVSGYNFSQIAGSMLSFTIGGNAVSDSITVDADGTFEGTITVPALALGELYELSVIDENGLNAQFDLLINHFVLLLSEYQGYSGEQIQITASGLRGTGLIDDKFDVRFGNTAIYAGIPATQTSIAESFYVPDVPPGIYEVSIYDHGWGYTISTDFQVVRQISEEYWYVDLHVQSGLDYSDITCGVIQGGTLGFDSTLGDKIVFPSPPEGVFAYINNINDPNVGIDTSKLLSNFHAPEYPDNWTFDVELIGISGQTSVSWSSIPEEAIPVGYSILLTTPEGYLDMQLVTEYVWMGVAGESYSFKILVSEIQTRSISLVSGWNLVSFSLELLTPSVESTLGSLGYSQIFRWNGASYVSVDTLEVGVGYWILVLEDETLQVSGYSLGSYTYVLDSGWNLVGCYDVVSVDLDTYLTDYYQIASWSGHGYDMSSSIIQPFTGYWVLVIEHTEFSAP